MSDAKSQDHGYPLATTGTDFAFRPNGRISPFFDANNAAGAHAYQLHLNSYMPRGYGGDPERQYQALLNAVTLCDVHSLRVTEVTGPDTMAFVDRLVTRDVTRMSGGRSSYVLFCDDTGMVIADPVMLILDRETIWFTMGTVDLWLWIKAAALMTDFKVEVREVDAPSVQLAGPLARQVMQRLVHEDLSEIKRFRCFRSALNGMDVVVSTTGYSDQISFEIYLVGAKPYPKGRELGDKLWRSILAAGEPLGLVESTVQFDRAMEAGFLTISHTEGDRMNALEHWVPGVVDLGKGDFVGKAALVALKYAGGPARRMVGLVATDRLAPFDLGHWVMDVWSSGKAVGTCRRIGWSRQLGRPIAIALVDKDFAEAEAELFLAHRTGVDKVRVTNLPFVAR